MSYETSDNFLKFPYFLCLSCLPFLYVKPWMTMRLEITIYSIAKRYYMAISSTVVTPPKWFLVASVIRIHMLSRMLGHVVLHQELYFLLRRDKLQGGSFFLFVHWTVVKPYPSSLEFSKDTSSFIQVMVERSFSFSWRRELMVFFYFPQSSKLSPICFIRAWVLQPVFLQSYLHH